MKPTEQKSKEEPENKKKTNLLAISENFTVVSKLSKLVSQRDTKLSKRSQKGL